MFNLLSRIGSAGEFAGVGDRDIVYTAALARAVERSLLENYIFFQLDDRDFINLIDQVEDFDLDFDIQRLGYYASSQEDSDQDFFLLEGGGDRFFPIDAIELKPPTWLSVNYFVLTKDKDGMDDFRPVWGEAADVP